MEFSKEIYNNLISFIEESKLNKNYELEIRFGKDNKVKKDNVISNIIFERLLNKFTFSKENNGFNYKYEELNTLDIFLNSSKVKNSNQRLSILGLDNIKKYWLNNDLENLSYDFIEKERINKIDDNNYNIRISLMNEIPVKNISEKNINLLKLDSFEKTYRLKNRYSIKTDDKLFLIDLTSVKSGNGTSFRNSNTVKNIPIFEIEIEFIGKDTDLKNDEIALKIINLSNILMKIITDSNIILTNNLKTKVMDNYNKLINNKNKNLNFIAANPITIHRENILRNNDIKNIYQRYAVTLKADGERNFLYVLKTNDANDAENGKIFLFNNNFEVVDTGFIDKEWGDTLIEGELININNTKEFYMYDILFSKGEDVRKKYLINITSGDQVKLDKNTSRLFIIEKFFKSVTREKVQNILDENTILIKNKKYQFSIIPDGSDIFQKISEIWDTRKYNVFEVDGIIFTPIFEYYPMRWGAWTSLFKWKPPYLNTIDFLIKTVKDNNLKDIKSPFIKITKRLDGKEETIIRQYKTFQLYVSGQKTSYNSKISKPFYENIPVLFNPFSLDDKNSIDYNQIKLFVDEFDKIYALDPITGEKEEIYDNIIVEFAYDENLENGFRWIPCRFRHDKTNLYKSGKPVFGNSEYVANDIFRAINNPVTEEMIKTGNIPISENKNQIDQKAYFSYLEGNSSNDKKRERFAYQNFHNFAIKYQLYYFSSPSYIKEIQKVEGKVLDLCCGKGVDINKIKKARYQEIVGMDIDINNIKYAQNYYKTIIPMPKPKAFYVRGDAGKLIWPNQDSGFTESDKIYTRKFIPTKYYFDTLSLMFCIHYLFEDEVKLRTLLQNLNDNLKIGGFVVGTTFDGERIYNELAGKDFISGKTPDGETMWKIDKNFGTTKLEFTDKKALYGKEIDVFVKTIGVNHSEFLVNFKYFDKIMQEYGFSLVMRKPFEEFYNEIIEEKNVANFDPKEFRMNIENVKKMSEDEKRFSFLSSGFIYKKEKNSSDLLFKKLVDLFEKQDIKKSKGPKKVKGSITKETENLIEYLENDE